MRREAGGDDGVVVDVVFESGALFLELANLSDRPALNVACNFDPPLVDLEGRIVNPDDYNAAPVPYTTARKSPGEYVQGREYLLILHDTGTEFTTAWPSSLAPTNEELKDENDPWLKWIRERVKQESH